MVTKYVTSSGWKKPCKSPDILSLLNTYWITTRLIPPDSSSLYKKTFPHLSNSYLIVIYLISCAWWLQVFPKPGRSWLWPNSGISLAPSWRCITKICWGCHWYMFNYVNVLPPSFFLNTRIYQDLLVRKKKNTILLITSSSSSVVQLLPSFLAQISRLSCSLDADHFCLLTPHISGLSFVWCFSTMWCPRNKKTYVRPLTWLMIVFMVGISTSVACKPTKGTGWGTIL